NSNTIPNEDVVTRSAHRNCDTIPNEVVATKSEQKYLDTISNEAIQKNSELFLDELNVGVTGTIVLMFCRIWDVNAVTGRYLSTDFVVSDGKSVETASRITRRYRDLSSDDIRERQR
ncbi:hypothetical protein Tco_1431476, partial [Tanacetum coccineum]